MNEESRATLEGYIDYVDWHAMRGWAFDRATPDEPLWLEVQIDDQLPVVFLANMRRQDLVDAGFGAGTFGFELRFPQHLDPLLQHRIDVRSRGTGKSLPNAPAILHPAPMASKEQRSRFEAAIEADIAAAEQGPELDTTIAFLLRQVDKLLQGRADTQSGATALQLFRLRWNDYIAGERAMPLQPDNRPWALVVDSELPDTAAQLALIGAVQSLGYRVAVVSTRSLDVNSAVAKALAAMDITVLGAPQFFTVEDVLRRHRGLYRAVIINGPLLAAAYGVVTRLHQSRAKTVMMFSEQALTPNDAPLVFGATLLGEFVVVDTPEMQKNLSERLPGRRIDLLAPDASEPEIASLLSRLLPRVRMTQPIADAPKVGQAVADAAGP